MLPQVLVKSGHIQPIWAGHPWVYAQAIEKLSGNPAPGAEVRVVDARGNALGRGLYSPGSAIAVRIFSSNPDLSFAEHLDQALRRALTRRARQALPSAETSSFRLVNAEGDHLPGLIVDCYGDVAVVRVGTVGIAERLELVLHWLEQNLGPRTILDRSSRDSAKREGFVASRAVLRGDPELDALRFTERGLRFEIPIALEQKTGFYLDQRQLRARVEALSNGLRVLDCHAYVGAVALSAARGGALRVDAGDSSQAAIDVARELVKLNGFDGRVHCEALDAAGSLARSRANEGYDLVILDPPKLAPTRASQRRGGDLMRRLVAQACHAVVPHGSLLVSSCSAAIGLSELTRAAALGAADASRTALVLERFFQAPDHPVPAAFPEGLYLCSLLLEIG
jgi:23S rRNA (cytosine1962-C5)-methyltransferase